MYKVRRGWGNHVLVNRSVLQQDISRTAWVSIIPVAVHPLVHMITSFTNILFSTLSACYKVDNIGRLTTSFASKLDGCPRRWLRYLCGVIICRFCILLSRTAVSPQAVQQVSCRRTLLFTRTRFPKPHRALLLRSYPGMNRSNQERSRELLDPTS